MLIVNMIPRSLSDEVEQDSEPSIAVNPANPLQIVGTAFTPDPAGSNLAPIYVSGDGGQSWILNPIVQSETITSDITVGFAGGSNMLYAGILRLPAPMFQIRMAILRTPDVTSPTPMKVLLNRYGSDQPFLRVISVAAAGGATKDRVYVGDNDVDAPDGRTATVDVSLNAAIARARFKKIGVEKRDTSGQNGPQVRPACHADGTVYLAFYRWGTETGNWLANTLIVTGDLVVVRDDVGATGSSRFDALVDDDGVMGKRVARGISFPFHYTGSGVPGQQRLGGDLALAIDPRNSSTVYLAWADQQPGTEYTVHLRRSNDRGMTWSSADLRTLALAVNPVLAITTAGEIGLLYQQLTGAAGAQRWVTHFERSADGINWNDLILCTAPADTPSVSSPPGFDPYLGDYAALTAVGTDFYGIFAANNTPDLANFPNGLVYQRNADFATRTLLGVDGVTPVTISIDTFFFKVP